LAITGCTNDGLEIIPVSIPKTSIPEGIVVDQQSKDIYLSSIHLDQLMQLNSKGEFIKTIFDRASDGYTEGVGMDIYQDKLYALATYDRDSFSMLYIKNRNTIRTLSYRVDNTATYFNDLAIDNDGNAYISDTENHHIYFFDRKEKTITKVLTDDQIEHPNGIAISSDQSKLFIDSYSHGIRIVDIKSKRIMNKLHSPTAEWGVDGIKYHEGKLFFIVNGIKDKSQHGLYSLDLIDSETEFGNLDPVMVFHEKMTIPTTFSIVDNHAYVIANSQMNLLNQDNNSIIDSSKFTPYYILKKKIVKL